mmetsp:Transcript_18658/g.26573  ORF Transcript_18658/g.26573 Transcript_18658/m.26573 type:complete len:83 (-) Transcript_18658:48-296(-)
MRCAPNSRFSGGECLVSCIIMRIMIAMNIMRIRFFNGLDDDDAAAVVAATTVVDFLSSSWSLVIICADDDDIFCPPLDSTSL